MTGIKAQSAMEYLTTYGWAILIIGISLGALYALGLFSPGAFVSNQCVFPADFGCLNNFLYTNGTFVLNIEQATDSAINITAIGCNEAGMATNMTTLSVPIYMPIGGSATFNTPCYANGTVFTNPVGTLYKGYIVVNYTSLGTGFQHVLVGTLIQKST